MDRIRAQRVLPVLRADDAPGAVAAARVCARAGLEVVELTATTPDVHRALEQLRSDGISAGLGTIRSAAQVSPAVRRGAQFVVSFEHPPDFVAVAHAMGVPAVPGALTPTEVQRALAAGADAVKVFPARVVGPAFVSDLLTVLPGVRILPTGGIAPTTECVDEWLAAGAFAVGLGSGLSTSAGRDGATMADRCRMLARRYVDGGRPSET